MTPSTNPTAGRKRSQHVPDGLRTISQTTIDDLDQAVPALYGATEAARSLLSDRPSPESLLTIQALRNEFLRVYNALSDGGFLDFADRINIE